jgi:hypothetical protein
MQMRRQHLPEHSIIPLTKGSCPPKKTSAAVALFKRDRTRLRWERIDAAPSPIPPHKRQPNREKRPQRPPFSEGWYGAYAAGSSRGARKYSLPQKAADRATGIKKNGSSQKKKRERRKKHKKDQERKVAPILERRRKRRKQKKQTGAGRRTFRRRKTAYNTRMRQGQIGWPRCGRSIRKRQWWAGNSMCAYCGHRQSGCRNTRIK